MDANWRYMSHSQRKKKYRSRKNNKVTQTDGVSSGIGPQGARDVIGIIVDALAKSGEGSKLMGRYSLAINIHFVIPADQYKILLLHTKQHIFCCTCRSIRNITLAHETTHLLLYLSSLDIDSLYDKQYPRAPYRGTISPISPHRCFTRSILETNDKFLSLNKNAKSTRRLVVFVNFWIRSIQEYKLYR